MDWMLPAAIVAGGLLGAKSSSKGTTQQTSTKEPPAYALPYLQGLMSDADVLLKKGMTQPFNPVEQGAMAAGWDNAKGGLFQLAPSAFDAGNKLASGQYNYNPASNMSGGSFNFGALNNTPDLSLKSPFVWQQNKFWSNDANPANWVPLGIDSQKTFDPVIQYQMAQQQATDKQNQQTQSQNEQDLALLRRLGVV